MTFLEEQVPEPCTNKQRQALYRILFRDPDHLKDIIRCLTKPDAYEVIRIFVAAEGVLTESLNQIECHND